MKLTLQLVQTWKRDASIAALVAGPVLMDAWWNAPDTRQADIWTYLLAIASILPLLLRHRFPIAVATACSLAFTGLYLLGHHGELLNLPPMVALYTVAATGSRTRTLTVATIAVAWSGTLGFTSDDPLGARGGSPMLEMIIPLVPLALGEATRSRRELHDEQTRSAARAIEEARNEERLRIARDLHDIVGHTMSAVNLQLNVAQAAFESDSNASRKALETAKQHGKDALNDLRASVSLLRDEANHYPTPNIDDIPRLFDSLETTGASVELRSQVDSVVVPKLIQGTVYRIIQEALTNVVRHSHATHVDISLEIVADQLIINVSDNGRGANLDHIDGFGILGMQERASLFGGTVKVSTTPNNGFNVQATIPLQAR